MEVVKNQEFCFGHGHAKCLLDICPSRDIDSPIYKLGVQERCPG